MAFDLLGWSRWSPHAANALGIAVGVPTVLGMIAGAWAYTSTSGLYVALVVLAVFMMALWCCIGVIWLLEKKGSASISPIIDCSWALRVDGALLNHNPNQELEWQLGVIVRNNRDFPIKCDVTEQRVVIEGRVPDAEMLGDRFPIIIGPKEKTQINFAPYKLRTLPDKEIFNGHVDILIRYGHPDGPFTRMASRRLRFETRVKPPQVPGLFPLFPGLGGPIALSIGPREQDRDEPYTEVPSL